jgi:tetratricopeptide (TPR) repeat protein
MHRWGIIVLFAGVSLAVAGCPKGTTDFNQGRKAQDLHDYDAAFEYYQRALKTDRQNAEYKIKFDQARFDAAELHIKNGLKLRGRGELENAASEFQKATTIDPASVVAEQELRKAIELIDDRKRAANVASEPLPDNADAELASAAPEIKPLSRAPINLKMTNDAKIVFDTIGKLAGLTIIYDPDFPAKRISVELNNVTLEQALDVVSIESKAFSKPITENIILVIPDQPQKRREYEDQFMRTFYLSNTAQPQDLTEVVTGLRQLLDLKRVQHASWWLPPGWGSRDRCRAESGQRAWSSNHFGNASTKHNRSKRHGDDPGHRDQGPRARREHPVDCAGERKELAAEADPIGDQRSHSASEAVNLVSTLLRESVCGDESSVRLAVSSALRSARLLQLGRRREG